MQYSENFEEHVLITHNMQNKVALCEIFEVYNLKLKLWTVRYILNEALLYKQRERGPSILNIQQGQKPFIHLYSRGRGVGGRVGRHCPLLYIQLLFTNNSTNH